MDADPRDQRIQELLQLVRQQQEIIAAQSGRIAELGARIAELEEKIQKAQREAHRSAAPFRRDEKQRKPPDQHNKPGRKKGHAASFRAIPAAVHEHVDVPLQGCPNCGGPVHDLHACVQHVEELPPITSRG